MAEIYCGKCGKSFDVTLESIAYGGSYTGVFCPDDMHENKVLMSTLAEIILEELALYKLK